jgi:hypothetical protein
MESALLDYWTVDVAIDPFRSLARCYDVAGFRIAPRRRRQHGRMTSCLTEESDLRSSA